MYGLDLFSGIGGITKALEGYVDPIAYCENDRYCQGVLLSRFASGNLPSAPIWNDVKTLRGQELIFAPDIIYGGFPCQDISVAGRGAGLAGERSGLFKEIIRLVGEIRPRFVFLENVPTITSRGGWEVVGAFASLGYDCRWDMLSAFDVGAPHLRERWFFLAYANNRSRGQQPGLAQNIGAEISWRSGETRKSTVAHTKYGGMEVGWGTFLASKESSHLGGISSPNQSSEQVKEKQMGVEVGLANSDGSRFKNDRSGKSQKWKEKVPLSWEFSESIRGDHKWEIEPDVGRVAHGISSRVDRLRGLGNAVVSEQAREAFKRLCGI